MQVEFVGGPKKNIEHKIKDVLKQSDKISIAVAFLENSGIVSITQSIEEIRENKSSISIITGLDFGITSPEALQELLNLDICCNIIHGENFHPKLYIFERRDNETTVIIGSSNLSRGGLSTNYEANIILNGNVSEYPIRDAIEYFSYLLSKSVILDDKIIELYTKKKNIVDELKNKVEKDERINELTDELNEYLNQKTSFIELTESESNELLQAEEKADEGWELCKIGKMNDAYTLLKESLNIYNKLINEHDSLKAEKENALFRMGWTLLNLSKFEEAKKCIEELESIASLTGNTVNLLSAIGLGALTHGVSKVANEKCDRFIEIYESNKSAFKDDLTSNIIGLVYSNSAECKYQFFKNKLNIAYKHCSYSIKYLGENLELANDDFSKMIAHLNLGTAYLTENNIKPEPDFDYNTIQDHYDTALAIAKNKLNSEFWEAKIRMYMADAPSYKAERCHNLKIAKEILNKLNHTELVSEADEMIKSYSCR